MKVTRAFKFVKALSQLIDTKIQAAVDRMTPADEVGIQIGYAPSESELEQELADLLTDTDT